MAPSPKQLNYINSLIEGAQTRLKADPPPPDELRVIAEAKITENEPLLISILQGEDVDNRTVSKMIDALKFVNQLLPLPEIPRPAGLVDYDRVVPNRFAKKCETCGVKVEVDAGFAGQKDGKWTTLCAPCAALPTSDVDRLGVLVKEILSTMATDHAYFALPSATGNNDLDFFRVGTRIKRSIGGQGDIDLSPAQQLAAAERILASDLTAAAALYGQQLGVCGRCRRTLTDDDSRAIGFGPECAGHMLDSF